MTDFSLIPKSLRSISAFGQAYALTHPDTNSHEIERKYLKALDVFFGGKRLAESPPEDLRGGMTGRVRKTFGANATQFHAPFEDRSYVPSAGVGTIAVNKIAECALPEWMTEVLRLAPNGKDHDNLEVYYNIREKLYIFGVCGVSGSEFTKMVTRFVTSGHSFLSKFYPDELNLCNGMLTSEDSPSSYFYGGENGIPGRRGYEGYWVHAEKELKGFKDFINNDHCLVSGIAWKPHACLLIKNPLDRKLYILDPNGVFGSWRDHSRPKTKARILDEMVVQRINRVVFKPRARTSGYTECQLLDRTKIDQGPEGSCAAQSFLRGVYILYKAHTNPGRSLIDFVNDDIPCVFAVFVSKLFQRANIITHETLEGSLASAHADDKLDEEHKQISEKLKAYTPQNERVPSSSTRTLATVRYTPQSNSGGKNMDPGAGMEITNQVSIMSNALVRVPIDVAFAFAGIHPGRSFELDPLAQTGPVQVLNEFMSGDGTVRVDIPETEHVKLWKAYNDNYEDVIFEINFNMDFLSTAAVTPELRKFIMEPYEVHTITNGDKQFAVA